MDLEDGLDPAQLAAVTNPTDPVCVLARAGAGKTRVLTRRIAWRAARGDIDVRRVLAITFTTRAAHELRDRLGALLGRDTATTGTFHAIANRMIRDHHSERGTVCPTILDDPRRVIAELVGAGSRREVDGLAAEIAWASARGVDADGYVAMAAAAGRTPPVSPDNVADLMIRYRVEKRRRRVMDFDDLIRDCIELFETDPAFARAQRWRHRHLLVDEYQDVNAIQQRLLDAWLGGRQDLFVVGDPNQAIYGFNGADASFLTGFTERYPDATVIELSTNHRSTGPIVRVADAVLARSGAAGTLPSGAEPTVTACADDEAEALTIARRARDEHAPGHRWDTQAVLTRTRAQLDVIADLFARAGIPVTRDPDHRGHDAVRLATFHAAKGLEWPVVHVAGVEEGYLPDFHARDATAIAEERRLLYVAASRATRRLHLTWARRRRFGERVVDRSPSRWLPEAPATGGPRRRTPDGQRAPAVVPVDPTPADEPRTRLLRWRASTARAAAVAEPVVIEDQVLDALVRAAPVDLDELATVPGLGSIKVASYGTVLLELLHPGRNP